MSTILNQIGQFVGRVISETRAFASSRADVARDEAITVLRGGVVTEADTLNKLYSIVQTIDGGAGSAPLKATVTFPGTLSAMEGKARWYPPKALKFTQLQAFVSEPADTSIQFVVKVSGQIFGTYTINTNEYNLYWTIDLDLTTADYLTVDITLVGNVIKGSDLIINFTE